ncbi:MAG: SH3 domain-containing protein [Thermacetogeniaceae bacterium]
MRVRPLVMYPTLVAIGVAAGFFLSSRVMAGGAQPGSAADPLVSRSYVDQQVATYIAGQEKRIADLTAREAQLEQALAQVQKQQGITPIQPAQTTQTVQPTQTSQPAQPSVSKKLYIKTENNYVNLRQGPSTNYPLVGTATRGNSNNEPMTVLSQTGDWDQVQLPDGRTGWVAGWLVDLR